ncbi:hypothetical protein pb186bvf_017763 [Paramecium bursaria]
MGSGASKSMNRPIGYYEAKDGTYSRLRYVERQKVIVNKPFQKLNANYLQINIEKKNQDEQIQVLHGIVGLRNLGNTCYLNTAIHCLSHTIPLLDYFQSNLYEKEINNKKGSKGQVTKSFANLLEQIWNDDKCIAIQQQKQFKDIKKGTEIKDQYVNPAQLLTLIQKYSKRFELGYQEDCQEVLSYLLDMIHEDLNRCKQSIQIQNKDYYGDPKDEWAAESWQEHLKANKSIIVDLFQGQLKSTCKCVKCGFQSHKFEPFLFLNLPIKQNSKYKNFKEQCTLKECLDLFQKEELLESKWRCPQCQLDRDCKKSIQIWKLPNFLIVHLKRFQYGNVCEKIMSKVDYPIEDLDLSDYCQKQENIQYDLYSIAAHSGTLSQGHYFAYCKNRNDQKWYLYNDESVYQVQDAQKSIVNEYAYVLFYQRQTDSILRQTLSNPNGWPHNQITTKRQVQLLIDNLEDNKGQLDDNSPHMPQQLDTKRQKISRESTSLANNKSPLIFKGLSQTLDNKSQISKIEQDVFEIQDTEYTKSMPLKDLVQQKIDYKTKGKFQEQLQKKK